MAPSTVLLFGGSSSERRVSVATAQNVAKALPSADLWFVAPEGGVHLAHSSELFDHAQPFERDFVPAQAAAWATLPLALDRAAKGAVFFLALHGGEGENGGLQRELERRDLAFTGSGSAASALAFDKERAKQRVAARGLRVAGASVLNADPATLRAQLSELFRRRGRLVVKPVADGSSVGLHHVTDESTIGRAAQAIADAGVTYLAEDFVQGTELTVGVIEEGGAALSLPASEVRVDQGRAFDFAGKYLGHGIREITPAEIAPRLERAAREAAVAAHQALGCYGYSRTDLIASGDGVTFLETNTLPGLTGTSFIPQQLAADGRSLERFIETQLELAVARRGGP